MKKKIAAASVAVFAVFILMDYLVHSVLLRGLYVETASLWRPMEAIGDLMWIFWVVDAVMAFLTVWLFAKGWEAGKSSRGVYQQRIPSIPGLHPRRHARRPGQHRPPRRRQDHALPRGSAVGRSDGRHGTDGQQTLPRWRLTDSGLFRWTNPKRFGIVAPEDRDRPGRATPGAT